MGQGASTEVNQQTEKNGTKEVVEKGKEEEIKDIDKTGSLRKKAWLKRKPSDQKSPKSKKKGKENKKKGSQDKLSITTEEPEKEEVSHRLSRIELHLEECQPAPDDDTISLSSCGENVENHLQDVMSDDNSTTADLSSSSCIANDITESISKDDSEPLNNTSDLSLANENQDESNLSKKSEKSDDEIHDLKEIKGDIKQDDSIEKQGESVEKKDGLIENQDDLKENHEDLKETINEKQDILKEIEDIKQDDLKEAQVDLNEKKDDLKESQEDCNEKKDEINKIIPPPNIEIIEVCVNNEDSLVEHSQDVIPVNETEEENDDKILVSSENDALNLESKRESEIEEPTVGVAVHVDDCHNIKEDDHTTDTDFIVSTQTNPDITFTDTQVTSANLEDLESHDDESEISSLPLDASSPLQDSRKDEIELQDAVKEEVVEVTEIEYTTEQVESEIKSELEVAPSNLVVQTEMMFENKDVNSEEIVLNNGDKAVCVLEGSEGQISDQEITHQIQMPNDDDVSLDSKTSKFDESITEIKDHLDDDIHHTSSMLSASETVCIVESNNQDLSVEMCSDEVAIEEVTPKVMDATATVEELTPDSSVNDGLNNSELTENTDNKESQYKINLNERNMSDPEVLLETIRMMEEAKAKGPSVEIMTTDLDAEDVSEETTLHPVNNTEESKVNNIEINNFQNSNTNGEEGSIGEPSDQSLAMSSSTSTEQSDNMAKTKPAYTDNSNGTVFV